MKRQNGHIYEFADFRLIPSEGLLLRNGSPIPLAPKAFSTLVLLVEQHGHLVEKTELIDRIWQNAFVEEAAVSRCVWRIRNALGEDPQEKEFIQTVPKRGYRFVANVSVIAEENKSSNGNPSDTSQLRTVLNGNGSSAGSETDSLKSSANAVIHLLKENGQGNGSKTKLLSPPTSGELAEQTAESNSDRQTARFESTNRIRPFFIPAGFLLVLFGLLTVYFFSTRRATLGGGDRNRIAVLPLKPVNAETRDPIWEFAIAESLILKLSSSKNLVVRPLSAVRMYIDLDQDPVQAGRQQNADFVLSSNYQIANGEIRVTSQLLNVESGQVVEIFKVEKDSSDVFATQDAVANDIGNTLLARFGNTPNNYAAKRGTTSEESYRLYIQGMYLVEKRNRADAARAIEIFDQALRLDPVYARAWAGKAHAHCSFSHMGGSSPDLEYAKAKPAIERALELDSELAEAYAVLGVIKTDYDWNFADGEKQFLRAIELDPTSDLAHRWYALRLAQEGRSGEALVEIKTAIESNPSSLFHHRIYGHILYLARHYDEAIEQLQRVVEMDSSFPPSYDGLWQAYHLKGDHAQAYEWFIRHLELTHTGSEHLAVYRKAYQDTGWLAVLRKHSEFLYAQRSGDGYYPFSYKMAVISALLGNKDEALDHLRDSLVNRHAQISFLRVDPTLDNLRGDPRYQEILRKMNL